MAEQQRVLIKKYGNRRLYNTETSQYITLEDLAQIVKAGRDIQVIDAKSQKDLTKSVLLQIITEREKDHDMIPVSFLRKMIQLSDQNIRDSLHRYLRVSLDAFLGAQREFEERYRTFASAFMNPMTANPMSWPMSFMGGGDPAAATGDPPPRAGDPPEGPGPMPADPADGRAPAAENGSQSAEQRLAQLQEQMLQMQAVITELQKKEES